MDILPVESVKLGAATDRLKVLLADREPEVPVMVSVFVAGTAELLAVSVSMPVPVVGFGFHRAVTPLGSPETDRVTLLANPYCGFTEIGVVLDIPWPRFRPPRLESVKVGVYTPRVRFVVALRLPEVPVMVSVLVPTLTVRLDVSVRVLKLVAGLGEKLALTPLGRPDTDRFTFPVNPYS